MVQCSHVVMILVSTVVYMGDDNMDTYEHVVQTLKTIENGSIETYTSGRYCAVCGYKNVDHTYVFDNQVKRWFCPKCYPLRLRVIKAHENRKVR